PMAVFQLTHSLTVTPPSGASPLPHLLSQSLGDLCIEIFGTRNFHILSKTIRRLHFPSKGSISSAIHGGAVVRAQ
ncbi:hypothetical protein, partial [Pseudomonas palleroniana]